MWNEAGTAIVKNNLVQNTTGDNYDATVAYHASSTNNLSGDATAPGSNSITSATVQFSDANNDDFHLSSSDTAAKDAGAMLCSDTYLPFSTDIDGASRPCSPNKWDIGADENTEAMINIKRNVNFGRGVNLKGQ
jgi:hypothetical protein